MCMGPEYEKMKKSAQKLSTAEIQKSLQSSVSSSGQTLPPKYDNYIHYAMYIMYKPLYSNYLNTALHHQAIKFIHDRGKKGDT